MFLGIDVGTGGTRAVLVDRGRQGGGVVRGGTCGDPVGAHWLGGAGARGLVARRAGGHRRG